MRATPGTVVTIPRRVKGILDGLFAPVLLAQMAIGGRLPALPCRLLRRHVAGFHMDALS